MPPSPIHRFPLSDNSANNSFECIKSPRGNFGKREIVSDMKQFTKCRFNQGHVLLRKQIPKPIFVTAQRSGKRRYTFSGHEHKTLNRKKRRYTHATLPSKFLLGGNRTDPLNLNSLQDAEVNKQLNAFSPASSPVPIPIWRRAQIQVAIPQNINDPLNLNTGEEIEFNLLSSKPRKRRRHRKGKKDENLEERINLLSPTEEVPSSNVQMDSHVESCSLNDSQLIIQDLKNISKTESEDEIPLIESDSSCTRNEVSLAEKMEFFLPRCCEEEEKQKVNQRFLDANRNRKNAILQFRMNAKKFCYGNHITRNLNWTYGEDSFDDERLRFFDRDLFDFADVLDIGCNVGHIALYIAKHLTPKFVTGIDIDERLIKRAQQKLCEEKNQNIASGSDFPQSFKNMYGPLCKLAVPSFAERDPEYPDNVSFLEANYVPANEEELENQRGEYDTILCLRVTKWIHLNFGDEGLKLAFKRMFAQLRYGGHLVLEPQPWFTYAPSKKITVSILHPHKL
ncbi:7SK snRNA methylphosphate capping enzyme [Caerostris extrusa]|uniref:RNA methyltransferase n=1 Tax=Caerostris extrusa TaxID=172846 RepID=A0AAV4N9D0_CAEEX|nr:7SK snRNA methylphosphate capping enzyme [Caerostris extrusa]